MRRLLPSSARGQRRSDLEECGRRDRECRLDLGQLAPGVERAAVRLVAESRLEPRLDVGLGVLDAAAGLRELEEDAQRLGIVRMVLDRLLEDDLRIGQQVALDEVARARELIGASGLRHLAADRLGEEALLEPEALDRDGEEAAGEEAADVGPVGDVVLDQVGLAHEGARDLVQEPVGQADPGGRSEGAVEGREQEPEELDARAELQDQEGAQHGGDRARGADQGDLRSELHQRVESARRHARRHEEACEERASPTILEGRRRDQEQEQVAEEVAPAAVHEDVRDVRVPGGLRRRESPRPGRGAHRRAGAARGRRRSRAPRARRAPPAGSTGPRRSLPRPAGRGGPPPRADACSRPRDPIVPA